MDLKPWTDTAAFAAALPTLSSVGVYLPRAVEMYRQFYGLLLSDIPHQYHMGCFQSDQFLLVGQIFQPPHSRGTLFVYHGYFDHLGLYSFPIRLGLELGMTVVGFDLPGHGLSSGRPLSIDCFSRYAVAQAAFVHALSDVVLFDIVPRPWSALGQSTGAAIILDSVLNAKRYGLTDQYYDGGLTFLAPLIRPCNWYGVRVLYQILRHRGGTPRIFKMNSTNAEFCHFLSHQDPLQHRTIDAAWVGAMIRYAKRIVKAPCSTESPLVIQGTQDATVDARYNLKKIGDLFNKPKIVMLEGARHHLVNESEEYKSRIRHCVREHLLFLGPNILE